MSLDVDHSEKLPKDEPPIVGGATMNESINRLKPKNQSLNEMYDPPGMKVIIDVAEHFYIAKVKNVFTYVFSF